MNLPKTPKDFTPVKEATDWLGQTVTAGCQVIVGQRDGNMERMWLGEVLALAEQRTPYQRYMGLNIDGDRIYVTDERVHVKACVQPVDYNAYSTHSKHGWPGEMVDRVFVPSGRPRPNWMDFQKIVKFRFGG